MEQEIIKNWIEGLIKMTREIQADDQDEPVNRLIGYCLSGEALLEKQKELK